MKSCLLIGLLIFCLGIISVSASIGGYYILTNNSKPQPTTKEETLNQNKEKLVFLTEEDKESVYAAIDKSKTIEELQTNLFNSFDDALRKYNNDTVPENEYILSPEFLFDRPEGVIIKTGKAEVNLLDNLELDPVTDKDLPLLKSFCKLFIQEVSRYPIAWMHYTMPAAFVFVKSVGFDGEVYGGVEQGVIVYNISQIKEEYEYTRHLIHHEIMHWVEQSTKTQYDSNWPGTNRDYTDTIDPAAVENFNEHPAKGFVTGYAKSNSNEDKAETYSYLFTQDGLAKLERWTKDDPVLKNKVDYIKDLIKSRVLNMDENYFHKIISTSPSGNIKVLLNAQNGVDLIINGNAKTIINKPVKGSNTAFSSQNIAWDRIRDRVVITYIPEADPQERKAIMSFFSSDGKLVKLQTLPDGFYGVNTDRAFYPVVSPNGQYIAVQTDLIHYISIYDFDGNLIKKLATKYIDIPLFSDQMYQLEEGKYSPFLDYIWVDDGTLAYRFSGTEKYYEVKLE